MSSVSVSQSVTRQFFWGGEEILQILDIHFQIVLTSKHAKGFRWVLFSDLLILLYYTADDVNIAALALTLHFLLQCDKLTKVCGRINRPIVNGSDAANTFSRPYVLDLLRHHEDDYRTSCSIRKRIKPTLRAQTIVYHCQYKINLSNMKESSSKLGWVITPFRVCVSSRFARVKNTDRNWCDLVMVRLEDIRFILHCHSLKLYFIVILFTLFTQLSLTFIKVIWRRCYYLFIDMLSRFQVTRFRLTAVLDNLRLSPIFKSVEKNFRK